MNVIWIVFLCVIGVWFFGGIGYFIGKYSARKEYEKDWKKRVQQIAMDAYKKVKRELQKGEKHVPQKKDSKRRKKSVATKEPKRVPIFLRTAIK